VSVDGGVSRGTREVLVLPVRNVQVGLRVAVFLGETKIDHVHLVTAFADTHQEVVGLDVSVDEVPRMNVLDSGDELIGKQKNGFEAEFAVAEVEEVFERWTAVRGQIQLTIRMKRPTADP